MSSSENSPNTDKRDVERESKENLGLNMVAGAIAGLVTDLFFFPLDTLKTRIQASVSGKDYSSQTKGKGLFSGLSAGIVISAPACACYWGGYELSKSLLLKNYSDTISPHFIYFISGAVAEFCSNTIRNPFEVVKQQMQMGLDDSMGATFRSIISIKGLRGFYAGYWSLMAREIPFSSLQMTIYETFKKIRNPKQSEIGYIDHAINGSVAGFFAAFLTTPVDVVKTQMMIDRSKNSLSLLQTANMVYRTDGLAGFFRAWHVRSINIGLCSIIFFTGYESSKRFLNQKFAQN